MSTMHRVAHHNFPREACTASAEEQMKLTKKDLELVHIARSEQNKLYRQSMWREASAGLYDKEE